MKQRTVWLGLALLALALAACSPLGLGGYGSNGERIYLSGSSANGRIGYSGGNLGGGIMMGGQQLACASCHGADGRGGPHVMHMTNMDAPDIRWSTLTGAEHGGGGDHEAGEMDHPPYDAETFKQAVTQGLNPGGEPLDPGMPRWRMSDRDLDDLIAFLQTLD